LFRTSVSEGGSRPRSPSADRVGRNPQVV